MNLTEEENKKYQSILRKIEKSCAEIELLPDFWEDNYEEEFAKWIPLWRLQISMDCQL